MNSRRRRRFRLRALRACVVMSWRQGQVIYQDAVSSLVKTGLPAIDTHAVLGNPVRGGKRLPASREGMRRALRRHIAAVQRNPSGGPLR